MILGNHQQVAAAQEDWPENIRKLPYWEKYWQQINRSTEPWMALGAGLGVALEFGNQCANQGAPK